MNTLRTVRHSRLGRVVLLLVALGTSACGLDKQSAPDLIGPSEFALSLALTASPEVLTQDDGQRSVIAAVVRDDKGRVVPNVTILWSATASTSRVRPVILSATSSVTDANGRATVVLSSPPPPTEAPSTPDTITVSATPQGAVQAMAEARFITVTLRPVIGTPVRNNLPVPVISASTVAASLNQEVTFDGSLTTDEGEICLDRCTYAWNFGDNRTGTGRVILHTYTEPFIAGATVTLTVRDDRGGTASATRTVTVSAAAIPVARFTYSPSEPVANSEISFDASGSFATPGVVIVIYNWDFGDGHTATSSTPTVEHTYDESKNPFHVTLTVTDSRGVTSQQSAQDIHVRD